MYSALYIYSTVHGDLCAQLYKSEKQFGSPSFSGYMIFWQAIWEDKKKKKSKIKSFFSLYQGRRQNPSITVYLLVTDKQT